MINTDKIDLLPSERVPDQQIVFLKRFTIKFIAFGSYINLKKYNNF